MSSDTEILRVAYDLNKRLGAKAWFVASKQLIAMMDVGNANDARMWSRIAHAIEVLQRDGLELGSDSLGF